jgi:hypothetical protein
MYDAAATKSMQGAEDVRQELVAFHNWTFLVGLGFTSGVNTVLMAYVMYKWRLVPRFSPTLELIGGPWVFASATAVQFGIIGQYSDLPAIAALPEFTWELTLANYLIAKEFNSTAIASQPAPTETHQLLNSACHCNYLVREGPQPSLTSSLCPLWSLVPSSTVAMQPR